MSRKRVSRWKQAEEIMCTRQATPESMASAVQSGQLSVLSKCTHLGIFVPSNRYCFILAHIETNTWNAEGASMAR